MQAGLWKLTPCQMGIMMRETQDYSLVVKTPYVFFTGFLLQSYGFSKWASQRSAPANWDVDTCRSTCCRESLILNYCFRTWRWESWLQHHVWITKLQRRAPKKSAVIHIPGGKKRIRCTAYFPIIKLVLCHQSWQQKKKFLNGNGVLIKQNRYVFSPGNVEVDALKLAVLLNQRNLFKALGEMLAFWHGVKKYFSFLNNKNIHSFKLTDWDKVYSTLRDWARNLKHNNKYLCVRTFWNLGFRRLPIYFLFLYLSLYSVS